MDLVWEIDYQHDSDRVKVRVASGPDQFATGFTRDPTIVALAGAAFTYRLWVQMFVDGASSITTMNVLPDCSIPPLTPAPVPTGLGVAWCRLEQPIRGQWPHLAVEFVDGRRAADTSELGLIDPIIRAGLVSGEGVFDLDIVDNTIRRIRVMHE